MEPACSIGLIAFESDEEAKYPGFISRYALDDAGLAVLSGVRAVKLVVQRSEVSEQKSTLTLQAVSHVDCECPLGTKEVVYKGSSAGISKFITRTKELGCFVWILSTPNFEVRALVGYGTQKVIDKKVTHRTLH